MISRRQLLQSGLSLAALPPWARAASDSALKAATGPCLLYTSDAADE